uniref:RING-type E3 ubiquitin transferase n=1 Tax=Araucaria cunninghamii TaxID=56994 RepID=A0A0D6QVT7_ARACU
MVRLGTYAAVSAAGAVAMIYHAFHSRGQFYPAMLYLSTSKISLVLLLNMGFVIMCSMWQLIKTIFLGPLREAEVERLNEQSWREVMEILFAITIFREEFSVTFLAMVTVLLLIKAFHWLAQKRVEYIETTPSVSRLSHLRILSFMAFLLALDCIFLYSSASYLLKTRRPSVELFFSFEYMILATTTISTFLKYVFYVSDVLMEGQWENKAVFTFYLELVRDLLHLSLYLFFFLVIFINYGLPLHLIRELYETFRNFKSRVADFIRYRKITSNMNDRFPDATPEELGLSDATCIICREEMAAAKKLPCGHLFHVHCLRSWLERQQTCPTCRSPVIASESGTATTGPGRGVQPEQQDAGTEGVQANAGFVNAQGQGSDANSFLAQHQPRVQAAAAAARQYGSSFAFPAAQPAMMNWSPGFIFVPQPHLAAGLGAANHVGTSGENSGRVVNSEDQEHNSAMGASPSHVGLQRWLEAQSQMLAAQRTSAMSGNNLLYPQVPLYGLGPFHMNHSNQIPPAMGAVPEISQSASSSSQRLDQAIDNFSGCWNMQQLLLKQRIEALQHELQSVSQLYSALQTRNSLDAIPGQNSDSSMSDAGVKQNVHSRDSMESVDVKGKSPLTSEVKEKGMPPSMSTGSTLNHASDFSEKPEEPMSSQSEIEEFKN